MRKKFSPSWKSSKKPSKQRKYAARAPLHIKGKLMSAHLSKELRQKYGRRQIRAKKGDKVKVMQGTFKGKTGEIEQVDTKNQKIFVTKVEYTKKDGSKARYPIHVSNVIITELNLSDKKRKNKLEAAKEKEPKKET